MCNPSTPFGLIIAGGSGTRLWPLSTPDKPKQFVPLFDERPMILRTFQLLANFIDERNIYVVTLDEYRESVLEALPNLKAGNLLLEPSRRGKSAAITYASLVIQGVCSDAVIFSSATDSWVAPESRLISDANATIMAVSRQPDIFVMLGVSPTRHDPSLGYAYARRDESVHVQDDRFLSVSSFEEKPSVDSGQDRRATALWNTSYYTFSAQHWVAQSSAMYPMQVSSIRDFISSQDPAQYDAAEIPGHELEIATFSGGKLRAMRGSFQWYDTGTWPSLIAALHESGESELRMDQAKGEGLEVHRNFILNRTSIPIVTIGLNDAVVVVTDSGILVADAGEVARDQGISRMFPTNG